MVLVRLSAAIAPASPLSPFEPDDADRDVVWMDGMFVRWGEKAQNGG